MFEIGTSAEDLTNVEELETPLPVPRCYFYPYAEYVRTADGRKRGMGLPKCRWVFPVLTAAQRDQLREFCKGVSEPVYIQTATNDDQDEYKVFRGWMHWVEEEERIAGYRMEMVIEFTELVEVEE